MKEVFSNIVIRARIRVIIHGHSAERAALILFSKKEILGHNYLMRALVYRSILKLLDKVQKKRPDNFLETANQIYTQASRYQGQKRRGRRRTFFEDLGTMINDFSSKEQEYLLGIA